MTQLIDSEEVARRLGVKLSTVYAYVSRGIITSRPDRTTRRSLFDAEEIDQLARRGRLGSEPSRTAHLDAAIASIPAIGPVRSDTDIENLAASYAFEEVAALLMDRPVAVNESFDLPPVPNMNAQEKLKWAVLMSEVDATLLSDTRRCIVANTAGQLMATMVDALQPSGQTSTIPVLRLSNERVITQSLAGRLTVALLGAQADEATASAVNAALILLADSELSTDTYAVRVAASARCNMFEAVLVGLSSLGSADPGSSTALIYELMIGAEKLGVEGSVDEHLRIRGSVPGFGASFEDDGGNRFEVLMPFVERLADKDRVSQVTSVLEFGKAHLFPRPRLAFALAALVYAAGMPRDAGEVIRSIGRSAGWIAHFLEELEEPPMRLRPQPLHESASRSRRRSHLNVLHDLDAAAWPEIMDQEAFRS